MILYIGVSIVLFFVSRFSPYEWRLIQYTVILTSHTRSAIVRDIRKLRGNRFRSLYQWVRYCVPR
uniref:Uncharacterized protein n=1 Tax=Megaselia scalaris TaxID=36166 RepID=T1GQU5_MEGSC